MVGTVMKYEFLRTRAPLALAGGIALAIAVAGYLLSFVSSFVATVPFVVGFGVAVAFTFGVQIYLAVDFYRSSFGRRGYFTHTLPVKGSTLVLSKLAYGLLASVAAMVWSVVLLLVTLSTAVRLRMTTFDAFWGEFSLLLEGANWFIWFMIINALVLILATLVQYYFAVAVGSEAWINKSGGMGPVITFLIVYVALQILSLLALVVPPSYDPFTQTLMWSIPLVDMIQSDAIGIPLSAFWITYALSAVLLWRTVVSVNKKLELR